MALPTFIGSSLLAGLTAVFPAFGWPAQELAKPAVPEALKGADLESSQPAAEDAWRPSTRRELRLLDRYGDFHVAVVGEEIITRLDLFSWIGSPRFEDPTQGRPDLSPRDQQNEQISAALTQLIEQRLKVQGGRAQGYETELIEAERERIFRQRVEDFGGPQKAAGLFEQMGLTPEEFKGLLSEGLMSNLWERSITGQMPGPNGRVIVDPFIRPGQQWARYREYSESRDDKLNAVVGRSREGKISLQQIVMLVPPGGKLPERVREEAQTLRDNIEKGILTFDEGIARVAPPEFRGEKSIVRDAPPERLAEVLARDFSGQADEVKAYVANAKPGTMSEVLEFTNAGQVQAFALLKVVDRTDASDAVPFSNFELQEKLRTAIAEEATEVRIARGLSELVRTTHLAPERLRSDFLRSGRRLRAK